MLCSWKLFPYSFANGPMMWKNTVQIWADVWNLSMHFGHENVHSLLRPRSQTSHLFLCCSWVCQWRQTLTAVLTMIFPCNGRWCIKPHSSNLSGCMESYPCIWSWKFAKFFWGQGQGLFSSDYDRQICKLEMIFCVWTTSMCSLCWSAGDVIVRKGYEFYWG
jgi:hypothetical protein